MILALLCLLFVAAYSQWALYASNQNTYFVHGLAKAGVGHLQHDWLVGTTDHLPVFSQIVFVSHRFVWPHIFYLHHALLIGVYVFSLGVIVSRTFKIRYNSLTFVMTFAVLTFLHSFAVQALMARTPVAATYAKVSDVLTHGVAGQYILGPIFQPSAFGVLLIASLALFLTERPFWAVGTACFAAWVHPSYLLHALLLTVGYGVLLGRDKGWRHALYLGLSAFVLALPTVSYAWLHFRPTDAEAFELAQRILVEKRIPHHASASHWFGVEAAGQVLICLLGLFAARRQPRLATVLLVLLLGSFSLTLLQIITGSHTLALLFPWRVSVLLVPVSTALLVGSASMRITGRLGTLRRRHQRAIWVTTTLLIIGMSSGGMAGTIVNVQRAERHSALPQWARDHTTPGDLFLIPPHDQRFRLRVGVPVFVDQKSHPYKDVELVEWDHRVELADSFYHAKDDREACRALRRIIGAYPVTHIVIDHRTTVQCDAWSDRIEFQDQTYRIVKVIGPPGTADDPSD